MPVPEPRRPAHTRVCAPYWCVLGVGGLLLDFFFSLCPTLLSLTKGERHGKAVEVQSAALGPGSSQPAPPSLATLEGPCAPCWHSEGQVVPFSRAPLALVAAMKATSCYAAQKPKSGGDQGLPIGHSDTRLVSPPPPRARGGTQRLWRGVEFKGMGLQRLVV